MGKITRTDLAKDRFGRKPMQSGIKLRAGNNSEIREIFLDLRIYIPKFGNLTFHK